MATEAKKKIEPEKYYSLLDVWRGKFVPTHVSLRSIRSMILADRQNKNLLKAVITGEGKARKYYIRGDNLAAFIKNWETGEYRLNW